jgi:acyl carrier protein
MQLDRMETEPAMDDIDRAVIAAAAKVSYVARDQITPDSDLRGLGIDSLDFAYLIQSIENALPVKLPDSEAAKAVTIGDLAETSRRALANRSG